MHDPTLDEPEPMDIGCVPIIMSVSPSSLVGGSGDVTCTVQINELPSGGCSVPVTCSNTTKLQSPSGSWPYALVFPNGGGTSAQFSIATVAVTSSTTISIHTVDNAASTSVTLTP